MRDSYTWKWFVWFFKDRTYKFFYPLVWLYGKISNKSYTRDKYEAEEPGGRYDQR